MADRWEFVDGEGLVAPDRWPYQPGRFGLGWVEEMRQTIRKIESRTRETADDVEAAWRALSAGGVYDAPEAQTLQGAMNPVVRDARHEAEICRVGARAADEYASEISGLETKLRNVMSEANGFRSRVAGGITVAVEEVPFVRVADLRSSSSIFGASAQVGAAFETLTWREHRPSVERNEALIAEVSRITDQIREAEGELARRMQMVDDIRPGRAPLNLGRVDALASGSAGGDGFMLSGDELEQMSVEEFRDWWNGLETWEQEAAANAMPHVDIGSQVVQGWFTDALRDAAGEDDSGDSDVESLDSLFQAFGHEEAAIDGALLVAGGGAVVAALRQTAEYSGPGGRDRGERAVRVAQQLREHVTRASREWSRAQAMAMAWQMVGDRKPTDAAVVAYLFADHRGNPAGEQFAVAMANELDKDERRDGLGPWLANGRDPGMQRLVALSGESDSHAGRLNDPLGRVFSTLGQYPDAALEWLTGEWDAAEERPVGTSQYRLEYYFETRDSSGFGAPSYPLDALAPSGSVATGDGFEGVAALWAGAQQATGGPYDPDSYSGGYDEGTWQKVATVTTFATRGLGENPNYAPENVSTLGSRELGRATALALPQLADSPVYEYDQSEAEGRSALPFRPDAHLPGVPGDRPVANVSFPAFAKLLAGVTSSQEGSGHLHEGIENYQDDLVAMALADRELPLAEKDPELEPKEVGHRLSRLQAILDGSDHGRQAREADLQDKRTERAINDASTVVKAIPIGGIDNPVVKSGVNLAKNEAVDLLGEAAEGRWTGNLAKAEERLAGEQAQRVDVVRAAMADTLSELGLYSDRPEDVRQAAITSYLGTVEQEHYTNYKTSFSENMNGYTDDE